MTKNQNFCEISELVQKIVGGGTPERNNSDYWNGGIPWATVKDFKDGKHNLALTEEEISLTGLKYSAANLIPPLVPIICTRMAVGRVAVANFIVAINQDLKAIYPNEKVDSEYLVWLIESIRSELEALSTGSTVKGIRLAELLSLKVFCPNKQEQTQIATILSTIDRAIEQTEALIAKQQRIKTGLMQDLLTKGIDENGNSRSEETHEFKDSPLGRIPVEWEVESCSAICKEIVVGIVIRPAQYYKPSGVPVLRSANVRENIIDTSDMVYMSERDNIALNKSRLSVGDLVTVRTGYPGNTAVITPELDGSNCVDIVISRPDSRRVRSNYLALWINSNFGKKQILEGQGGLAQQHFNVGEVRKLLVKVPSINEQIRIEDLLLLQGREVFKLQSQLQKLKLQKTGLMQDLLTGKVRVTELIKERETDNL